MASYRSTVLWSAQSCGLHTLASCISVLPIFSVLSCGAGPDSAASHFCADSGPSAFSQAFLNLASRSSSGGLGAAVTTAPGSGRRGYPKSSQAQNNGGGSALCGGAAGVLPLNWSARATQPPPIAL